MSQSSRQVGLTRVAPALGNLLVAFSLVLSAFPSQAFAAPGVPNWAEPALNRNDPAASNAPARLSDSSQSPAINVSALITISANGFTPGLLSTNANILVVWVNTTNATQILESGAPNRLYLPLERVPLAFTAG